MAKHKVDSRLLDSVVVHRQSNSGIPTPTLAEALIASKKSASTLLTFNSLRKTVEKVAKNAVYLEGVLGYDESMLKDILRPQLRGLVFAVRWIVSFCLFCVRMLARLTGVFFFQGEEDVIITFDPASNDLEPKLYNLQQSLRTLAEDTGYCATVELVSVSEDGTIKRGSWTPVGTSSRAAAIKTGPIFSTNAFAALGESRNSANTPRVVRDPSIPLYKVSPVKVTDRSHEIVC